MSTAPMPAALGRYVIESQLGRGAMGVVYRARDPRIDRVIALKTLSPVAGDDAAAQALKERFLNEGRAAGRLSHRAIVAVYDADEDAGIAYLAMECIEGTDLKQLMKQGLPIERLVEILSEVAEALDHAHERGVIHRDVKPANVLIDGDGRPHLTDFGIARLSDSEITQAGEFLGTPAYMAPEQVRGKPVSPQTDIYALGVILYEGLTGRRPFEGESMVATATAIASDPPLPPSLVAPVSPAFDGVIDRALAKDPKQRHARASAFAEDMRRGLLAEQQAPHAPPTERPDVATAVASPKRKPVAAIVAVAAIALAGVLATWRMTSRDADDASVPAASATAPGAVTAPRGATARATSTAATAPAATAPVRGATAPPKPRPAPVAKGTLVLQATSPRQGELVVRDGEDVVGRLALDGRRNRTGQREVVSVLQLREGSRDLDFEFVPEEGRTLTATLKVDIAKDGTTRVIADVGLLGRTLDVKVR